MPNRLIIHGLLVRQEKFRDREQTEEYGY